MLRNKIISKYNADIIRQPDLGAFIQHIKIQDWQLFDEFIVHKMQ